MKSMESISELIKNATESKKKLSQIIITQESVYSNKTENELYNIMAGNLQVMRDSIKKGMLPDTKSVSGLTGGNAYQIKEVAESGKLLGGDLFTKIIARAVAVAELNAAMGKIVAAPTAGSCGIVPSVLITVGESLQADEHELVLALFTAAGIGSIIAQRASISGAECGCQAECGTASAMAAAAVVDLYGGTPEMVANACALALKNQLGLVCDPVAGLVEVPCVKRNAFFAIHSLVAADLALAGVKSVIPADEVISAMKEIGQMIPSALKETAEGGLANTPTARLLSRKIFGK